MPPLPSLPTLAIFGVKLVGANAENARKLLLSVVLVVIVLAVASVLRRLARRIDRDRMGKFAFWAHQAIHLLVAATLILGMISVWFDDPTRLSTFMGLVTAGVAFALQRVITALAGYFIILRGKTFNVGDRIVMGGVRGDVVALGLMQTTIMEMGQPPPVQNADPAMWVKSRQYTGRIVTVTNDKIFDEPVYNYTRDFPYIWEEISLPVTYQADRARAEQILLDAAQKHTIPIGQLGEQAIAELERRYVMQRSDIRPQVYWRLTDNWLELTVRFLSTDHGIRDLKDKMARDILPALDAAGIGIASATFEIVGLPPLRIAPAAAASNPAPPPPV